MVQDFFGSKRLAIRSPESCRETDLIRDHHNATFTRSAQHVKLTHFGVSDSAPQNHQRTCWEALCMHLTGCEHEIVRGLE